MKVNLLIDNPDEALSGYVNLDPYAKPDDKTRTRCEALGDLSSIVDDGEAEEIVARDIVEYFRQVDVDQILNHWLGKLRRGGTLTITFVDIRDVTKGYLNGSLSVEDYNILVHGTQTRDWDYKKSSFCLLDFVATVEAKGYKTLMKRVTNYQSVFTCQRVQ
jgi:hypothetical protein